MSVDCSDLENRQKDCIARKVALLKDANDLFTEKARTQGRVDEIKGRLAAIDTEEAGLKETIDEQQKTVDTLEQQRASVADRVSEYQHGIDQLQADRDALVARQQAATDDATRQSLAQKIAWDDAAIAEHRTGIAQLRAGEDRLESAKATVREGIQRLDDDWQAREQERQSLAGDLPGGEQDAAAAADRAARAQARLDDLEKENDDIQRQLDDCYRRKHAEAPAEAGGAFLRP